MVLGKICHITLSNLVNSTILALLRKNEGATLNACFLLSKSLMNQDLCTPSLQPQEAFESK
jgi:hypothetical protein